MMDYGVLWVVAVVTSLLLTALAEALFSSFKKALWRHVWMVAVIGGLTCLFGIASLFAGLMYYNNLIIPSWLFPYTTSFALIYVIAAAVIWRKGLAAKAGTPPARAWRRGILASCLVLGIILTMTAYTLIDLNWQIAFTNVNTDLKIRLQEIWPSKPPPHSNAYPLYERASDAIANQDMDRILNYTKPDQYPRKPEIKELVERNRKVIDTLHLASQRPLYFWGRPVDTSIILLFEFPQFPRYRRLAGLLGLKAKIEALSGNPAGAVRKLAVIRSMAEHLRSSPDLLSWMISAAVTKQEFDFTEYLLAHTHSVNGLFTFPMTAAPSVLQSCKAMMINEAAMEVQLPFLMMQQREVIEHFVRTYSEMFKSFGASPPIGLSCILHPLPRSLWRVFIGQSYVDNVRDKWEKINRITESGYKHWRDFSSLKASLEGRRASLMHSVLNQLFGGDEQALILNYIHRFIVIDVYRQLIDLAIAASVYREVEGSYPETVDDLVPAFLEAVPIDPYEGKPLKIEKVPGGLDLYSAGPYPRDVAEGSGWRGPIHFYLGRKAYETYRVEPTKLKRAQEAEERKERERKQMEWDKKRKSKPGTILKKKRKPKRK